MSQLPRVVFEPMPDETPVIHKKHKSMKTRLGNSLSQRGKKHHPEWDVPLFKEAPLPAKDAAK